MNRTGNQYQVEITANNLKDVELQATFPCFDCKNNKPPICYANKHLNKFRYAKLHNPRYVVTERNSTMKCRSCTSGQVNELQCEGPCGEWKSLSEFSKSQRSKGDGHCKDCVSWRESATSGAETVAATASNMAPGEEDTVLDETVTLKYDSPQGGDLFNDFNPTWNMQDMSQALLQAKSTLAPTDSSIVRRSNGASMVASPQSSLVSTAGQRGYVPSHLRDAPASTTGAITTQPDYCPPHLRGLRGTASKVTSNLETSQPSVRSVDMRSTSSVSNPYRTTVASSGGVSGHGIQFNGYDSTGRQYTQYRYPSGNISMAPPNAPDTATTSPPRTTNTQQPQTKSVWPKSVGARTTQNSYNPLNAQPGRHDYDSDGFSPDEM